ncbi:hypothetical protein G7Z17_g76 [Cylindrodendrum hubeiense]|uniref:Xylanolytic transcriptional activator regulatory domain-containing protein n=1 Tax=Cylindrodendrum hubeiense TaxID=595255 RepID=A0A9P5HKY0_9HYPO|nr:hypothetical protein G7Z17_g76 [Cylindrodendrum hubeiense]
MDESTATSYARSQRAADSPDAGRPPKRPREDPVRARAEISLFRDLASRPPLSMQATSEQGSSSNGGDRRESFADMASSQLTPTVAADLVLVSPTATHPAVEIPSNGSPSRHVRRKTDAGVQAAPHSMRNSPEPSQTDQQGHYVGPASGVSFLLRIQRKLQIQSPGYLNSSTFNFGDRPLPGHDSSFAILPPKPLAESMVRRYFDFAAATHRFLHRPSIEAWLEELYETNGAILYQESARSRTALLFMVFAHSNNFRPRSTADAKDRVAESAETGKSRVDLESSNRVDHIDLECRKRTFWCAYNLNTYLSAALGRPMTFHDEYIDQELPLCVDDEQLRVSSTPPPMDLGPSITSATVAQIKPQEMQENIKICIDAATHVIEHIDHIDAAGELYSTLFPSGDIPANATSSIDVVDGGLAHMASWGQFDSLVTGGMGTLDMIPQSDVWDSINNTGFNTW